MSQKAIINASQLAITIHRLAQQIIEYHGNLENTAIIGIQPRGILFSDQLVNALKKLIPNNNLEYGYLDVSFYRDDVHTTNDIKSYQTNILFSIENKNVILIDDVLYTGRTIRSALDALLDFGRPKKVELCVLIDRKFSRHVPIQADYIGIAVDSVTTQKVIVNWQENNAHVALINNQTKGN